MRFVRLRVLFYWLRGRLGCNWYPQWERRNHYRIEIAASLATWARCWRQLAKSERLWHELMILWSNQAFRSCFCRRQMMFQVWICSGFERPLKLSLIG